MDPALLALVLALVALGAGVAALILPSFGAAGFRQRPGPSPVAQPAPGAATVGTSRQDMVTALALMLGVGGAAAVVTQGIGLAAVTLGLIAPLAFLQLRAFRARRYQHEFAQQFLPALEVIVRGLKSGMPLIAALQVVQKEIGGPVQAEFRRLLDDLSLGMTLAQAVERLATRIPSREAGFFAHVVAMQSRTGGRLSEALGNLADTLRARNQFAQKVRIVSQEARSSALIIGILPFLVAFVLFLLNPAYISLMFTTTLGQVVVVLCLVWMGLGALIMKRMVEIDV